MTLCVFVLVLLSSLKICSTAPLSMSPPLGSPHIHPRSRNLPAFSFFFFFTLFSFFQFFSFPVISLFAHSSQTSFHFSTSRSQKCYIRPSTPPSPLTRFYRIVTLVSFSHIRFCCLAKLVMILLLLLVCVLLAYIHSLSVLYCLSVHNFYFFGLAT